MVLRIPGKFQCIKFKTWVLSRFPDFDVAKSAKFSCFSRFHGAVVVSFTFALLREIAVCLPTTRLRFIVADISRVCLLLSF